MRTITLKSYSVSELSAEIKAKILGEYRYINVEGDAWTLEPADLQKELEAVGLSFRPEYDLSFDLNDRWVRIENLGVDLSNEKLLGLLSDGEKQKTLLSALRLAALIGEKEAVLEYTLVQNQSRTDGFIRTQSTEENLQEVEQAIRLFTSDGEQILRDLERKIEEFLLEKTAAFLKLLDEEFQRLTSDEVVLETLECNEYAFTAQGTRLDIQEITAGKPEENQT
jgi:hypothetical protein